MRRFLYLSEAQTRVAAQAIDPVAVVRAALIAHASGETILPPETTLRWTGADGAAMRSISMPALVKTPVRSAGVKVINRHFGPLPSGEPSASGLTLLLDPDTAAPRCLMSAGVLSALRTAAVTVAAFDALATGQTATRLALIGAGPIAEAHARLCLERLDRLNELAIYDCEPQRAEALTARLHDADGTRVMIAGSALEAIDGADLVVAATTTTTPYIEWSWLMPGTIVANVSLDDVTAEVFRRADRVYVDDLDQIVADEHRLLGKLLRAQQLGREVSGTLGELLGGRAAGRPRTDEIVVINPFGLAIEDVSLVAAVDAYARANRLGSWLEV